MKPVAANCDDIYRPLGARRLVSHALCALKTAKTAPATEAYLRQISAGVAAANQPLCPSVPSPSHPSAPPSIPCIHLLHAFRAASVEVSGEVSETSPVNT